MSKETWNKAWQKAYDYTLANWHEGVTDFQPPDITGPHSGAVAEGMRSGINKILDRLYPGAKSLTLNPKTKKYIPTY